MLRPFTLRVLDALTVTLEGITVANGYQHDMVGKVFRGRVLFDSSDPLPMISILEPPVPPEQQDVPDEDGSGYGDFNLLVQGFVKDDSQHPTDPAHLLLADIKRALVRERMKRRNLFGLDRPDGTGGVIKMRIGTGSCRPSDEVSEKAYCWLTLTLEIVEDLDDPFA